MRTINYQIKVKQLFLAVFLLSALISCNEDYTNLLKEDYGDDVAGKVITKKKVLYIIADGLNGDVVKHIAPTNLGRIAENSFYSYESLMDIEYYQSNEYTGWATLLTGVNPSTHGVKGATSTIEVAVTPSLFDALADKETAVYTSSDKFNALFSSGVDKSVLSTTDAEVTQNAVSELQTQSSDFVVVNYTNIDVVGKSSGYQYTNTAYVDAVNAFDSDVQSLVAAVESRTTYAKEDWLVVVVSSRGANYGSTLSGNNFFLMPEKNNVVLFYNPKFATTYKARPGTEIPFNRGTQKFTLNASPVANSTKAVMVDGNQFNLTFPVVGSAYTFQFKIKMSGNATSSSWPEILTKGAGRDAMQGGYAILSGSGSSIVQFGGSTVNTKTSLTAPLGDGIWHTITCVFKRDIATSVKMTVYLDGGYSAVRDLGNITSLSNTSPLVFGRLTSTGTSGSPIMSISQFFILNKALTELEIKNSYCKTEIDANHPATNSLMGLWRFDEMTGTRVENKITNDPKQAFVIQGTNSWVQENSFYSTLCPTITDSYYQVVPMAADAPLTIANWLGLSYSNVKKYEGRTWPFNYTNLRAQ